MNNIEIGEEWIHKKSGNVYIVEKLGHVKINGLWERSVSYTDGDSGFYTRTIENFLDSFIRKIV